MTEPLLIEVAVQVATPLEVRLPGETIIVETAAPAAPLEVAIPAAPLLVETVSPLPSLEIELGIPGPIGPPGETSEDAMPYARRTDFVGSDVIYKGEAEPGTLETTPAWRIRRITLVAEDVNEQWAAGAAAFAHAWSDRATLDYI